MLYSCGNEILIKNGRSFIFWSGAVLNILGGTRQWLYEIGIPPQPSWAKRGEEEKVGSDRGSG